jgi:hypothetical protein
LLPLVCMRVFGSILSLTFLIGCGSEPYEGAQPFSANSAGLYTLTAFNGQDVNELQSVQIQIIESGSTGLSGIDRCSSVIALSTSGQVLSDGRGSSGCFIDFGPESLHPQVLLEIQTSAPVIEQDGRIFIGLAVFTPSN